MDITHNGINYFIERNENESDLSLQNRIHFIAKQNPNTKEQFNEETKFSNIWINRKLLGCQYSEKLENTIDNKEINL
tara:strand:+ start:53 stop:283 length:231 start_codon:yes stop_codon:yes gene_type:complete